MRARFAVVPLAVMLLATARADAGGPQDINRHLRPADRTDAALVNESLARSATLRDLVARLDATDVVTYVTAAPCAEFERDSSIHFVGRSPYQRFMVIKVNDALPLDRQIALVGHELQHALDMAPASWITDGFRMSQYFALTGWKDSGPKPGFETTTALRTERRVAQEAAAWVAAGGAAVPPPR
jgi:hypothetical protein